MRGDMLKKVVVENCGHTDYDFFCYYEYKEKHEPEENKIKYPNPKDRWYETYMDLSTITAAKLGGAEVDIETYMSDRLEWNEKHQKFIIKREIFNCGDPEKDELHYQKQFTRR